MEYAGESARAVYICMRERGVFCLLSCVACYQVVYLSQRGTVDVHTKDERNIRAAAAAAVVISIIDRNAKSDSVFACHSHPRLRDDVCGGNSFV